MAHKISDVGEKALIRDFIKPYFNSIDDPGGVGDDCAMVIFGDEMALVSTDRVPNDLTALRLGILDYHGLGDYLARLNLSDIAACGGQAVGLLLNLGLPNDFGYEDLQALCCGFRSRAERHGARVLGGDITSACRLNVSATAIGRVRREHVLTRRKAKPGDSVFISRPLGMTPAALHVLSRGQESRVSPDVLAILRSQFIDLEPMLSLGQALSRSEECSACMDNTDGIGQTFTELSEASGCALVISRSSLRVPRTVEAVSKSINTQPLDFVFDGGADFSLVGTLRGEWSSERALVQLGYPLEIVGRVELGQGVWLEDEHREPLKFRGWNYFRMPD